MKPAYKRKLNKYYPIRHDRVPLFVILLLLLSTVTTGHAQQGGISIGDTVEVTAGEGLRLRSQPGTDSEVITKLPFGTRMRVVGGPSPAGSNVWWELDGEPGRGWAAENFLKVVEGSPLPSSSPSVEGANCEQTYSAIQYCTLNNKTTHVVLIDLSNPHVRFETIMADDADNVNTEAREYVRDMGARLEGEGAVAVINADYFGGGHGPEGFTVVNGERLDGSLKNDDDNMSVLRSSLVFSKPGLDGGRSPIFASIQRLLTDAFTPSPDKMFNAIGGGPQVVFDGRWDWARGKDQPAYNNYPECPTDFFSNDVINGECFRNTGDWDSDNKMWTVVGKAKDGRLLMLLTTYPNIKSMLETYQVQEAIKLDGGGSSQLWYNNRSIVPGDGRQVANGLAVFYKNDYEVQQLPQWPVIVSGERLDVQVVLRNIGSDTWTREEHALSSTKNPWNMSLRYELPTTIGPGGTVTWKWQSDPIEKAWGIYSFDLQMVDKGNEFPTDPIRIQVVVIPKDLAEKKEELEQQIRNWIQQGIEDIEKQILSWVERQLNNWIQNCLKTPVAIIPFAILLAYKQSSKQKRPKEFQE